MRVGRVGRLLLSALAVAAVCTLMAACGTDPAPTPTPVATSTPTPEPTQPPLTMRDLRITQATTGQHLVDRVSGAEAGCLSSTMGDANYRMFLGAPLMVAVAAEERAYALFAACLEQESLVPLGVGLMGAHMGGWSADAVECVTDLSLAHPELVAVALGVEGTLPDAFHSEDVHSILLDMYECLGPPAQVKFSLTMISSSLLMPYSGQQFLATIPESEAECLRTDLPESLYTSIANSPSVGGTELQDAPPEFFACLSPETLGRLPGEVLAYSLGATSTESRACVVDFLQTHSHFLQLDVATLLAKDLTEEENAEVLEAAQDGWRLFSCMTEEELARFQETYLPLLVP